MTDQTQMDVPMPRTPIGPDWQTAVRTCAFFSWGENWISREISRITGGPSHMGIGFSVIGGEEVYYENLFAGGFQGPKNMLDLRNWAKAPGRLVEIYWLALDPATSERKHVVAHTWVGLVGYAEWKILAFLWYERIGRRLGFHMRASWNRWVCSTSSSGILAPEADLSTPDRSLAEQTPKSARDAIIKKQLWEKVEILDATRAEWCVRNHGEG